MTVPGSGPQGPREAAGDVSHAQARAGSPAAAQSRTLWLGRHGQTDDNLAGDVFQGFRDTPLNDTGRAQARTLGERLAADQTLRFGSLWCSDLSRAHETARIVGALIGLEPRPDARLREGNRGDWEGRRFGEVQASEPEAYAAWLKAGPEFRFPGGESLAEQQARVLAALADYRAAAAGGAQATAGGAQAAARTSPSDTSSGRIEGRSSRGPAPGGALVICHRGSIRVALCSRDPRGLYAFHDHDVDNTGVVEF